MRCDWRKGGSVVIGNSVRKVGILTSYVEETDALAVAKNGRPVFGQGSKENSLPNEGDLFFVGLGSGSVVSSNCVAKESAC